MAFLTVIPVEVSWHSEQNQHQLTALSQPVMCLEQFNRQTPPTHKFKYAINPGYWMKNHLLSSF